MIGVKLFSPSLGCWPTVEAASGAAVVVVVVATAGWIAVVAVVVVVWGELSEAARTPVLEDNLEGLVKI